MCNPNGNVYVICDTCFEVNSIFELEKNEIIFESTIRGFHVRINSMSNHMYAIRNAYYEKVLYDKAIEDYVQEVSA